LCAPSYVNENRSQAPRAKARIAEKMRSELQNNIDSGFSRHTFGNKKGGDSAMAKKKKKAAKKKKTAKKR
jgi:hypothetical protein